jgi:RNA-binding protein
MKGNGKSMDKLSGKQARYLRGLGHHLQPIVMVGREEISDRLLASVEEALGIHELIKIKLQEGCLLDRREVARILAEKTASQVAQVLGKTILLYRAGDQAKINLP